MGHKHIISGQWQLTEFDAYPCSKNIKAFPVTEESEKNALLKNVTNKEEEMEKANKIIKSQKNIIIKLKTEIEFLKRSWEEEIEKKLQMNDKNKKMETKFNFE